jgi:rare lipoprotein A
MHLRSVLLAFAFCACFASGVRAETGIASVYADGDGHQWTKTANGERVNPDAMTAAHRTLRFGTHVQVTNIENGRTAIVRISDRGPFVKGRIIDLTPAVARALGFSGLILVSVTPVM